MAKIPIRLLLNQKQYHPIYTIEADASVWQFIEKINHLNVGALCVMNDQQLEGMISERDIIRKIVGKSLDMMTIKVKEIMTTHVISITPDSTISQALSMMTHKRIRHLPVLEENKLIAMISIGDLTKWIIEQQQKDINHLTSYINNEPSE